jgi:hypothetical protein
MSRSGTVAVLYRSPEHWLTGERCLYVSRLQDPGIGSDASFGWPLRHGAIPRERASHPVPPQLYAWQHHSTLDQAASSRPASVSLPGRAGGSPWAPRRCGRISGARRARRLHAARVPGRGEIDQDQGGGRILACRSGFGRPQQTTLIGEAEPAIMPSEISQEELAAEMRRRVRELEGGAAA